jgi:hypothetical protein
MLLNQGFSGLNPGSKARRLLPLSLKPFQNRIEGVVASALNEAQVRQAKLAT